MSRPVLTATVRMGVGRRLPCCEVLLGDRAIGSVFTNAILWTGSGWPEVVAMRPRSDDLETDILWILDQIPLVADMDVELVYA